MCLAHLTLILYLTGKVIESNNAYEPAIDDDTCTVGAPCLELQNEAIGVKTITLISKAGEWTGELVLRLYLLGLHQQENLRTAVLSLTLTLKFHQP